jgi:hypothetical protein
MRNSLFVMIFAFTSGCATNEGRLYNTPHNSICFVLPNNISSLFKDSLNDSSYFYLSSDSNYYSLYIGAGDNKYAHKTNRKIFINGKFYPLFFDYDMSFGTNATTKGSIKHYSEEKFLKPGQPIPIKEGLYVEFRKSDFEIIRIGNDMPLANISKTNNPLCPNQLKNGWYLKYNDWNIKRKKNSNKVRIADSLFIDYYNKHDSSIGKISHRLDCYYYINFYLSKKDSTVTGIVNKLYSSFGYPVMEVVASVNDTFKFEEIFPNPCPQLKGPPGFLVRMKKQPK